MWQTLSFCYQEVSLGFPLCDSYRAPEILCFIFHNDNSHSYLYGNGEYLNWELGRGFVDVNAMGILPVCLCRWSLQSEQCFHHLLQWALSNFLNSLRLGLFAYKILIKSIQMDWQVDSGVKMDAVSSLPATYGGRREPIPGVVL